MLFNSTLVLHSTCSAGLAYGDDRGQALLLLQPARTGWLHDTEALKCAIDTVDAGFAERERANTMWREVTF